MIDPVIFTIGGFPLRWYGVIVMVGVIVGSLYVERELKRYGENSDSIWDALIWILPIGIIGARLWFVANATLGGDRSYIENPSHILKIWEGGLHIYGGLLFGGITLIYFLRRNNLDVWLFFDAAGPAMLIGQAIGRIANFINQELYGPPTTLPWGIPITENRLPQFANLPETTRFHPTFAYEMLWNFATAGLLIWLSRRYEKEIKPGTIFAGWLMAAGVGRVWLEIFFRPDQPKIGDTFISYSLVAAALMAVAGAILLLARFKKINLAFAEGWEEEYKISGKAETKGEPMEEDAPVVKEASTGIAGTAVVKKTSAAKPKKATPKKTSAAKTKTTAVKETSAAKPKETTVKKTPATKSKTTTAKKTTAGKSTKSTTKKTASTTTAKKTTKRTTKKSS